MDIRFKNSKVDIAITNVDKDAIHNADEMRSIFDIINLLKSFEFSSATPVIEKKIENKQTEVKKVIDDRPVVRDRLPNSIDLSEVELKKAVTEEPMIRCPNCGQASIVLVEIDSTHNYLMRKVTKDNKDTFEPIMELSSDEEVNNILKPENANTLDYYNDIMKIKVQKKLKNVDINVSKDTSMYCPICRINANRSFSKWVDAFKHPLEFGFETDMLCDVCGKEAVSTIDENKNEVIVCESCGSKRSIVK